MCSGAPTIGTVFHATTVSPPLSPPATDHLLQPYPSTPPTPSPEKKTDAEHRKEPPPPPPPHTHTRHRTQKRTG